MASGASLLSRSGEQLLCCYRNTSNQIAVASGEGVADWTLQHVVFPGERFMFEAPAGGQLRISRPDSEGIETALLSCSDLSVNEV